MSRKALALLTLGILFLVLAIAMASPLGAGPRPWNLYDPCLAPWDWTTLLMVVLFLLTAGVVVGFMAGALFFLAVCGEVIYHEGHRAGRLYTANLYLRELRTSRPKDP